MQFVRNITDWKDIKPALYHGHMAYLDFSKWVLPIRTKNDSVSVNIDFSPHQILNAAEAIVH